MTDLDLIELGVASEETEGPPGGQEELGAQFQTAG
jgi:hypothetical protein